MVNNNNNCNHKTETGVMAHGNFSQFSETARETHAPGPLSAMFHILNREARTAQP